MSDNKDIIIPTGSVPVITQVFEAMAKDSAWVHNQVEQNYIREIEELRSALVNLFCDVKEANERARSIDIADALAYSAHHVNAARQPGWWSSDFKKNF